ncbi:DUF6483 family protein [uncultured Microscilla sp.]|uniref:DUF6483 family protein n=1 Tax=uncultured Microscilla sp. TaxID=432653 RepID=UPI002609F96E|nr:DUF6483 family protein [uncultured Microscilla sp.]
MIRRDYILKLIDQLVMALKKIRGLKDREFYEEALELIAEKKEAFLKIDAAYLDQLSVEDLQVLLDNDINRGKELWTFEVDLLFEEASIYDLLDNEPQVFRAYHQALTILTHLIKKYREVNINLFDKLAIAVAYLRDFRLPWQSYEKIIDYYKATQQFAHAEDMLFQMATTHIDQATALLQLGHAFYAELLNMDDQVLSTGKLPRSEVESGLKAFKQKIGGF